MIFDRYIQRCLRIVLSSGAKKAKSVFSEYGVQMTLTMWYDKKRKVYYWELLMERWTKTLLYGTVKSIVDREVFVEFIRNKIRNNRPIVVSTAYGDYEFTSDNRCCKNGTTFGDAPPYAYEELVTSKRRNDLVLSWIRDEGLPRQDNAESQQIGFDY